MCHSQKVIRTDRENSGQPDEDIIRGIADGQFIGTDNRFCHANLHCKLLLCQFCPNCGASGIGADTPTGGKKSKKKKPIFKKWWFWLIIIIVAASIGSGGSSDDTQTTTSTDTATTSSSTTATTQSTPEEAETPSEPETPAEPEITTYNVGDVVTAKSYTLTIQSFGEVESGNQFMQPDEGNVFLEVELLIENTSSSDLTISSLLCFDAYVDDFSISQDFTALAASDKNSLDGTIASGKKIQGILAYQVPEDWESMEVVVDLGFSSSNEVTLLFQH